MNHCSLLPLLATIIWLAPRFSSNKSQFRWFCQAPQLADIKATVFFLSQIFRSSETRRKIFQRLTSIDWAGKPSKLHLNISCCLEYGWKIGCGKSTPWSWEAFVLIEDVVQIGNGEKSHAISTVTSFLFRCFFKWRSTDGSVQKNAGDYQCSQPWYAEIWGDFEGVLYI